MSTPDPGSESGSAASPRAQLIGKATRYLTERGLGDLSLRELAAAIGTSHRMLIYHFGSKEGVLVEVVQETERQRQRAWTELLAEGDGSLTDMARRHWQQLRSPQFAPVERLYFELYAQALQGRPYATPLLHQDVSSWTELVPAVLSAAGYEGEEARAAARLGAAVVRGLLLDLLATGDTAAADAAFELYLAGLTALEESRRAAAPRP